MTPPTNMFSGYQATHTLISTLTSASLKTISHTLFSLQKMKMDSRCRNIFQKDSARVNDAVSPLICSSHNALLNSVPQKAVSTVADTASQKTSSLQLQMPQRYLQPDINSSRNKRFHEDEANRSDARPSSSSCLTTFIVIAIVTLTSPCYVTANNNTTSSSPIGINIVALDTIDMLAISLPMMEMAVEHINQVYEGLFRFNLSHGVGACSAGINGAKAAEISCSINISAFIGPSCSVGAETVGYMAGDWNVPLMTIGNTGNIGNKTTFPTLTRVNPYSQTSLVKAFFTLMDVYQWNDLVVFSDDSGDGNLFGLTVRSLLGATAYEWHDYIISTDKSTVESVTIQLRDATSRARVILLFLSYKTVVNFWTAAEQLGYTTSGEFVWIEVYLYNMAPSPLYLWEWFPSPYNETLKRAYDSQVILLFIDTDDQEIPENITQELISRSLDHYGYDYTHYRDGPRTLLIGMWNSIIIYAHVLNETVVEGGDPLDGRAITDRMWNRTFQGLVAPIRINENGDQDSDVKYFAVHPDDGKVKTYAIKYGVNDSGSLIFLSDNSFPWRYNGGSPPPNEPVCGFTGRKCSSDTSQDKTQLITATTVSLGLVVILASIVAGVMYRRWKRQSEADLWWWLIEAMDLNVTEARTQSVLSLTSQRTSSKLDVGSINPMDGSLAKYKDQIVRKKKMKVKSSKLKQLLVSDFKVMREISHNNLSRLHGACLEDNSISIIMEHCPKGTLQDLLGNTNMTLDAQFKFSLCRDIVDGLSYLHHSPIKCHGRLNSEVCWLDSRFTVKLSDFGLPFVYSNVVVDNSSQEYKNSCLWIAPENLRSLFVQGSKEGDIYSFGIILSEVISRESPYSEETNYMTIEEILDKLRKPCNDQTQFRPVIEVPAKLSDMKRLMDRCWSEDPKHRPSVHTVKAEIKRIAKSLGETGNLLDNLLRRMEQYANNLEKLVEEKTVELRDEKKRSEELLYQILPRSVADRLKAGLRVEPEQFDCVTIYFSDIVGFTVISASSTAIQIVDLLNDLYSYFDSILEEFDVYKVETIGDAYMVVSGLPQRNGNLHAVNIARMSLKLLCVISSFKIRHKPDEKIKLRIGLHSGAVCAGVVGLKMPRYCLFGDTVNTASRMESHGEALRIHMSDTCKEILDHHGTFDTTLRGEIEIKGKGRMSTYWLNGESSR